MLAVQWKIDLDRLDGMDTIPRLSKEEMNSAIPWEMPVTEYKGLKKPDMQLVATNHFEKSAEILQAPQIYLSRFGLQLIQRYFIQCQYSFHSLEKGIIPVPKSAVVYLPLINMKLGDPTTVLT